MPKLITPETKLYCIFGKPVSHSMSPLVHNMLFNEFGVNAVYLAFEINDIKKGVDSMRTLGIKGASITIPFKEDILKHLDEIDEAAHNIGAVNTVINKDGYLVGYNTDCAGAVEPLKEIVSSLKNKRVCILGAGGAARAVAFGIKKEGGDVTIVNRSKNRGKQLSMEVNGKFLTLSEFNDLMLISAYTDILINTTSVGMTPNIDESPVNSKILHKNMTVMDIIYNPLKTELLKDAELAGCTTVDGLSMFIHQGAAQFEMFTGFKASHNFMRETVLKQMV